jgi:putative transposase
MPDILPLLLMLSPALSRTTCRQLSRIVVGVLAMSGRVTQRGISRWSSTGGSYRTIQRFFHTEIDWLAVQWLFFCLFVYDPKGIYLLIGDETVITKAGKATYGLDRFFSSLFDKAVAGLGCFSLALVHVGNREAYSLSNEQVIRTQQEKQEAKKRQQQRKANTRSPIQPGTPPAPKRPRGRPKGSKNKNKAVGVLSPELLRIQAQVKKALALINKKMALTYFVLDGHFGNHLAAQMVRQLDLHLIAKMRSDAALYLVPTALQKQLSPHRKYGNRLDFAKMPEALLRSCETEGGYETRVYQALCLHKQFAHLLNVVVLKKTHLDSGRVGHVILFSTDPFLGAQALIDYYTLRFQIEFTFRDAKGHFGLEDFMGIKKTSVTNAMSLSLFLVNLSRYLLGPLRALCPGAGIGDLKSWYRGHFYASALLKRLPQCPDAIVCEPLIEQICRLGFIHLAPQTAPEMQMAA